MSYASSKALNVYAQTEVQSALDGASAHKMILMLFDGAVKAVAKARFAMLQGNIPAKCQAISQAMAIIHEGLQLSLDKKVGGVLAENLNDLYEYMCTRLLVANVQNQVEPLDEVGKLLVGLRNAWAAVDTSRKQPVQPANPPVNENSTDNSMASPRPSMSYGAA